VRSLGQIRSTTPIRIKATPNADETSRATMIPITISSNDSSMTLSIPHLTGEKRLWAVLHG
jgi:hypothetical protein